MGPSRSLANLGGEISLWLHISASTISCCDGTARRLYRQARIRRMQDLPCRACISFVACHRRLVESSRIRRRCLSGRTGYPTTWYDEWWGTGGSDVNIPGLGGTPLGPVALRRRPTPARHPRAHVLWGMMRELFETRPDDLPSRPPRITMKLRFLMFGSPATSASMYFPRRFFKPSASLVSP